MKLDQGYKSLLRGSRKAFKSAFEASGLAKGKHHWDAATWRIRTTSFLTEFLSLQEVTDLMVNYAVVILYPTFGKNGNEFVRALGSKRIQICNRTYDRNNKTTIRDFFMDETIAKFWPIMMEYSEENHYFARSEERRVGKECRP